VGGAIVYIAGSEARLPKYSAKELKSIYPEATTSKSISYRKTKFMYSASVISQKENRYKKKSCLRRYLAGIPSKFARKVSSRAFQQKRRRDVREKVAVQD